MSLTLYYHPLASFCHKVLVALYENGTAFDKRLIDLGNAGDRAELEDVWPLCKFPVLRDHARGHDLPETSIIIEYLDQHYPGSRKLIPSDPEKALDVRLWDRFFDLHVQGPMNQVVLNKLGRVTLDVAEQHASLAKVYGLVENRLAGRVWICGDDFSMADCAAAPALFYASTLVPFSPTQENLRRYFDQLMKRPSVARTLEEARPYFPMYPFANAIPARFLG